MDSPTTGIVARKLAQRLLNLIEANKGQTRGTGIPGGLSFAQLMIFEGRGADVTIGMSDQKSNMGGKAGATV